MDVIGLDNACSGIFGTYTFCCYRVKQDRVCVWQGDANYGRPLAGSKTELRGKQAGIHISTEVVELCSIIRLLGVAQPDGSYAVTFGDLFEFYTRISNKVISHSSLFSHATLFNHRRCELKLWYLAIKMLLLLVFSWTTADLLGHQTVFVVNQKDHKNCRICVLVTFHSKSEMCARCSPLGLISGFQPITQTNKWCYLFSENSRNAPISDVKMAKMLFDQKI